MFGWDVMKRMDVINRRDRVFDGNNYESIYFMTRLINHIIKEVVIDYVKDEYISYASWK